MSTKKRKRSKSKPASFPYRWEQQQTRATDTPGIVYREVEVARCTVTRTSNGPIKKERPRTREAKLGGER